MMKVFLSRPNWVPKHIANHLIRFYDTLKVLEMEAHTIGTNVESLSSPFEEVVNLMKRCDCTIVLGLPQIRIKTGEVKEQVIDKSFSLPTEWNHIEAAISIMMQKPTLMMLHRGVATRGLFEKGAANVFVHEFHTVGSKWVENMNPKLIALKAKVDSLK